MKISSVFKSMILENEINIIREFCKVNKLPLLIEENYSKDTTEYLYVYILAKNITYTIPEHLVNNYIIQQFIKDMNLIHIGNNIYKEERSIDNYVAMSILSSNQEIEDINREIQKTNEIEMESIKNKRQKTQVENENEDIVDSDSIKPKRKRKSSKKSLEENNIITEESSKKRKRRTKK